MDVGLVCDACSALTPIGVPQCTRCGAAVALDPRPRQKSKPPPVEGMVDCSKCGMRVSEKTKFCPNCGNRLERINESFDVETKVRSSGTVNTPMAGSPASKPGRSTLFFGGAMQAARA